MKPIDENLAEQYNDRLYENELVHTCPRCDSTNVAEGPAAYYNDGADIKVIEVVCENCGLVWSEEYIRSGWEFNGGFDFEEPDEENTQEEADNAKN